MKFSVRENYARKVTLKIRQHSCRVKRIDHRFMSRTLYRSNTLDIARVAQLFDFYPNAYHRSAGCEFPSNPACINELKVRLLLMANQPVPWQLLLPNILAREFALQSNPCMPACQSIRDHRD